MTLFEQIMSADDLPRKAVDVPEWGATVYLKTFSGAERAEVHAACAVAPDDRTAALFVAAALCDESGAPVASAENLDAKNPRVIARLFEEALAMNRLVDPPKPDPEKADPEKAEGA